MKQNKTKHRELDEMLLQNEKDTEKSITLLRQAKANLTLRKSLEKVLTHHQIPSGVLLEEKCPYVPSPCFLECNSEKKVPVKC